jgi:hypothetical protein
MAGGIVTPAVPPCKRRRPRASMGGKALQRHASFLGSARFSDGRVLELIPLAVSIEPLRGRSAERPASSESARRKEIAWAAPASERQLFVLHPSAIQAHSGSTARPPSPPRATKTAAGSGSQGAYGIRTRVTAVRGRRPRPLDECASSAQKGSESPPPWRRRAWGGRALEAQAPRTSTSRPDAAGASWGPTHPGRPTCRGPPRRGPRQWARQQVRLPRDGEPAPSGEAV